VNTFPQRLHFQATYLSPFGDGECLAVVRNLLAGSSISRLSLSGRPPAVFGLVISIWVNAINGIFRARTFAHVLKEVLKAASPSLTDSYASGKVKPERIGIGSCATGDYRAPAYVSFCFGHSVSSSASLNGLKVEASATPAVTAFQASGGNGFLCPAVADAIPECFLVDNKPVNGSPTTEFLARKVLKRHPTLRN
jgi:hypothetical protein